MYTLYLGSKRHHPLNQQKSGAPADLLEDSHNERDTESETEAETDQETVTIPGRNAG